MIRPYRGMSLALLIFTSAGLASERLAPAVWFEPKGAAKGQFQYVARMRRYDVLLSGSGLSIRYPLLPGRSAPSSVSLTFPGSQRAVASPGERLPGYVNELVGTDPRAWRTNVPICSSLRVPALYRGIDLVYRGTPAGIEYDFLVSPGGDPRQIRMRFSGAKTAEIREDGELILSGPGGEVRQSKPVAYQEWGGRRHPVEVAYVWRSGDLAIQTGRYDRKRLLVIDPVVVVYAAVFGGARTDQGEAIAMDDTGAIYIAGRTDSYDFPITPGAADNVSSGSFVAKLKPDGATVVYSTYVSGKVSGVAVDHSGSAYVIASTYTGNHVGLAEGIQITKLSPAGDAFLYRTSFPGPGLGRGIAVDRAGNAYVTGSTAAADFPVTSGAAQTALRGTDAFVAKLDPRGQLVYATYLGGSGDEEGRGIALDSAGNAYLTGVVHNSTDFPVVNAAQPKPGGAFVYRSDDSGVTWKPAGDGITAAVQLVTVDPSNGDVAYAVLHAGGVFKTTDAGAQWIPVGEGLGRARISALAIDGAHPSTLYAVDGATLFRSLDGGTSWRDVGAGTVLTRASSGPVCVSVDRNSSTVYAGRNWLAKSTDGGNTWQMIAPENSPGFTDEIRQLEVDAISSAIYLSTYWGGLKKSTDGGATWKILAAASYFAISPSGTLFFSGSRSTSRSDDGGISWKEIGEGAPTFIKILASDASGGLYTWPGRGSWAGGSFVPGELYKLSSNSQSWKQSALALSGESALTSVGINYVTAFAAAPSTPGRLYFAAAPGSDAFVAKVSPAGTELLYSTYLGGISNDYGNAIAIDAAGGVYIAGSTASIDFPGTAAGFQRAFAGGSYFRDPRRLMDTTDYPRGTDAFVAKLNAAGTSVVYSSYLGGERPDWALGLAVDSNGSALVTGYTGSPGFPRVGDSQSTPGYVPPNILSPAAFLSQVAPDGSRMSYSSYFTDSIGTGIVFNSENRAILTGYGGLDMNRTSNPGSVGSAMVMQVQFPVPSISAGGVVDPFTYSQDRISPGSLISIFGRDLADGEEQAQSIPLPFIARGVSATVDGVPAPLFYVGPAQINLQVPWEVRPGVRRVEVVTASGERASAFFQVQTASPVIAVIPGTSRAIAINEDQSLNGVDNPAPSRSVITVYLIGQGPVSTPPVTGGASPFSPLARATLPASVLIGSDTTADFPYTAGLEYLGLTPGMVGLAQANIRLPDLPGGDYRLVLTTGDARSNVVTVSVGRP
ncbi:MAG TPA: SBBP repeat-containing protein [Bryobacteraceae bacterium]|nr:SBBP repeat-containing protein [Bryobacteraceae bacterium]